MAFLEVKNIDVFYGDVQVIFDLTLHVDEGEVVSIIGGNGAGKSTLLRSISGLVPPAKGEIRFEDVPIHRSPPEAIVERGVVHVPEGRRLFSLMSVKDNLIVGAYNSRADKDKEITVQEVFELFPRLREREAMMAKPKLLMLDEPSLGLAPLLTRIIFDTVRKIADQGTTVVLVEQDVKHSLSMSDRGYVLEHGRTAMEGPARQLLDDPHIKAAYLGM
jgi:branched-chain amino acid transport system ATP-binding protein